MPDATMFFAEGPLMGGQTAPLAVLVAPDYSSVPPGTIIVNPQTCRLASSILLPCLSAALKPSPGLTGCQSTTSPEAHSCMKGSVVVPAILS